MIFITRWWDDNLKLDNNNYNHHNHHNHHGNNWDKGDEGHRKGKEKGDEGREGDDDEKGPNDARRIVWALGEFFSFFLHIFWC